MSATKTPSPEEWRAAVAKAIATGEPQEVRRDGKLAVVISAPRDRRPTEEELLGRIATLERERDECKRAQAERDRWRVRAEAAEARISEMEETLKGLGQ